jgi:hypothetical protein
MMMVTRMQWVRSVDSLYNFIAYVVGYAPDRFPVEDYLPPEGQMTLERAFEELRAGMRFIDPEVANEQKRGQLTQLLDDAYSAYRSGDERTGAHLLQDFEGLIFKK